MVELADGPKRIKIRKQVAAVPVTRDDEGRLMVMLITSRETRRLIVPKGWAMKGRKDHRAAAIEAREEAGLIGRVWAAAFGRAGWMVTTGSARPPAAPHRRKRGGRRGG